MPSHTTVAAYLALFIAVGGTAFAAVKIGSKQIKDDSVQSKDVKNKTLVTKDLEPGTIDALRGQQGVQGPAGPPGPSSVPANAVLVGAGGTPIQNGSELRAAIAALPAATSATPREVVLGVGHYDAGSATGFTVPPFVTMAGQGPHTVVENLSANSAPVITLSDGSVLRDLSVVNTSATVGARAIAGESSKENLIEDVVVDAREGIHLRSSILRNASIRADTVGLRIAAPAPAAPEAEIDNASITVGGTASTTGVVAAGGGTLHGVDASVTGTTAATGLLYTANSGTLAVRDSSFSSASPSTAIGVDVDPSGPASTATLFFDHSKALGGLAATSFGFRTSGSLSRIGSSTVDGVTAAVSESAAPEARCIDTHDNSYASSVLC